VSESQIGRLLTDLWADLREPAIFWQIGTLALCVLLAWGLARRLQWRAPEGSAEALKRGAAAARRVAFPLLAALLLLAARPVLAHWHSIHLLSVAIALIGALAVIRFAVYLLRIAFAKSGWLDSFELSIATLVWAALALHLTGQLPEIVRWLSEVEFSAGKHKLSLWAMLSAAFWVAVTVLVALWAGAAVEARLMRAEHLHSSLRAVFARIAKALLLVVAVLIVLPLIGVDLTVLSVFGGALGVGLGLGLQKIASNYLSGFIILLDRSIRLGDLITVDGQHGQVTRITTRYVVVRSGAGVEAIIPNDTLVTTTVLNHSYTDNRVQLTVRVQVAYGSDLKRAIDAMLATAAAHPRVLKDPAPSSLVVNLADSGVLLELGFWIDNPAAGGPNVRSELSVALLEKFRAEGIEIPYPRHDVRLLQGSSGAKPGQ